MELSTQNNVMFAFSPMNMISEHAKYKSSDKHERYHHQQNQRAVFERKKSDVFTCTNNESESVLREQNKTVNKSANLCFGGFFNANKIYKSNILHKSLEFASDNGALFMAGVSLVTATFFRPIAILFTPGVKKENKEYACGKSIAGGSLGFALAALITTPIAAAVKKINANPAKFLKKSTIENLKSPNKDLLKSDAYKFSTQLFKLSGDTICAIPKVLLTCALIPPLVSWIFRNNNKISQEKAQNINTINKLQTSILCFKSGKIDEQSYAIFKDFMKGSKNVHTDN